MRGFHVVFISPGKAVHCSAYLPGDIVQFCTGVILLLATSGLQATSGVTGVVVLSLTTRLFPEDSLQH